MNRLAWIVVPVALGLMPATGGCGLFRRRNNVNTNVSSNVEINQSGRDVATLERHEYEVIDTSIGVNKSTSVFVLTIPVGSHTSQTEQVDSAYFGAVDRVPGCDAMLMPRVETKRTLVPLLLINIVVKRTTVKGRCIHVKDDDALGLAGGPAMESGGGGSSEALDSGSAATTG